MAKNPKNWNATNPAAPAFSKNVVYQAVAPDPDPNIVRDCSSYMPFATATVAGLVPTPPNDVTKWLRGDATWQTIVNTLAGLTDVTLTSLADKDILMYDSGSSKWKNRSISGDITISSSAVVAVTKIQSTAIKPSMSLTDGDILTWVAANSRWENLAISAVAGANASSLRGTTIVTTTPKDGWALRYVAAVPNYQPLPDQPYNVHEGHADMTGNSVLMATNSGNSSRWATNNASSTAAIAATATEKMLFQMTTNITNSVVLYGCNQSLHVVYTLGNVKRMRCRVGLPATTSERFWIGLSDWTNANPTSDFHTDTPAHNFVGFFYSTNLGHTTFQAVCQTGAANQTLVNTAITVTTAMRVFEFYYDGSAVQFYIDGVNVGTISTNLPTTSLGMDLLTAVDLIGAGSKSLNLDYMSVAL